MVYCNERGGMSLVKFEKELDIDITRVSAVYEDSKGRLICGLRGGEIIELKPKL